MASPERSEAWLARDRERGGRQGPEPRVGGGAALERVDELGNAMAAVDEPEKQLEVRDEDSHRHRPRDHPLTALPHDEDDPGGHDGGVDGLEPRLQSNELEVALGKPLRETSDSLHRGAGASEQSEHPHARQVLLQRRCQIGARLTGPGGAARDPAPGGVGE